MIVQQKRCWNLNIYLRALFYFIFNWSVYPLISSTKSGPRPELEENIGDELLRDEYISIDDNSENVEVDDDKISISSVEETSKMQQSVKRK